jgi:hypothetical protein
MTPASRFTAVVVVARPGSTARLGALSLATRGVALGWSRAFSIVAPGFSPRRGGDRDHGVTRWGGAA